MGLVISGGGAPTESVFITGISGSGNVVTQMMSDPNDGAVFSVELENKDGVTVALEWDRGSEYEGLPTVNGVEVTKLTKAGGTYTGSVVVSGVTDDITAIYSESTHVVPVISLDKPTFTCDFTGAYPGAQTELKEGDTYDVAITSSDSLINIEVANFGAGKSLARAYADTFAINIADRGDTVQSLHARMRVQNSVGTWSDWVDTATTVECNNLHPTIDHTTTYPGIQLALKNSEEVAIAYTLTNADSEAVTVTPNLTVSANGAIRASGDYETGTYTLTATRAANDADTVLNEPIRIAHVDVALSSNDPVQVRSGVGAVTLACAFTQDLLFSFTNPTITATSVDTHSDTVLYFEITATNLANKVVNLQRAYRIKGFARKTLTIDYPDVSADIGCNIVNLSNLVITGTINTTPTYEICKARVATPNDIILVSQYALTDNQSDVTIDKQKCSDFGYDSTHNLTILVEEL